MHTHHTIFIRGNEAIASIIHACRTELVNMGLENMEIDPQSLRFQIDSVSGALISIEGTLSPMLKAVDASDNVS